LDAEDAKAEGPKRRGFVITIKGTTPYKDYNGLAEEMRKSLLALSPDKYGPQGPYRIDRVIIPKADKIKKEDWLKTIGASRSIRPKQNQQMFPGQAMSGQQGTAAAKNKGPEKPAAPESRGVAANDQPPDALFVDPLTKEGMENDYSITLL